MLWYNLEYENQMLPFRIRRTDWIQSGWMQRNSRRRERHLDGASYRRNGSCGDTGSTGTSRRETRPARTTGRGIRSARTAGRETRSAETGRRDASSPGTACRVTNFFESRLPGY